LKSAVPSGRNFGSGVLNAALVSAGIRPRRHRGRPRAYDPQAALQRATDTFWRIGYSGTTVDRISAATGMNRPSLYAAFGDHQRFVQGPVVGEGLARRGQADLPITRERLEIEGGALACLQSGVVHLFFG
jgi:Bacterial regulatory proteins, tetR family